MVITATGRTFEHRDTIRALGGWWSAVDKCWKFDRLTQAEIAKLRGLVGVLVSEPPTAVDPLEAEPTTIVPRRDDGGRSTIYGNDPTYHNHFADQNARAFFGFDSLTAFVDHIDALPPSITNDPRRSGWEIDDGDWRGSRSMPDALKLARGGWQEGVERAADIVDRLTLANPRVRRRKPSIAGGSVNVGRMLAGNPAHMLRRPKLPGRKVVTFFVEAGCPGHITAQSLLNRATLVAAMIDLMENVGYSCNVVAVDTSLDCGLTVYQLAVTLKNAGERLDLNDIVFGLGHPSFLRRLSFAACSSVDETRIIWRSQGGPSDAFDNDHPCGANEFYVPVLKVNGGDDPLSLIKLVKPDNLPITIERD